MRRGMRSNKGFTLTEILVAIAIFAIIFIAALMIYDRSNQLFKRGVVASDSQQSTRVAFDRLVSDLRMAGFDYDRDGKPITSSGGVTQYQQPDEPIEFVGRSALTFRANLDYDDGNDNGREPAYESGEFPVVTTGNDEIVTYALESADASKNTNSISFFADTSKPRNAYPGGAKETEVKIDGVDLSNANPPYTLYRYTLSETGAVEKTAIASNIRSLRFTYYEDQSGTQLLTDVTGTTKLDQDALATNIGGKGQYDPDNSSAFLQERAVRSKVRSIQLQITGMHELEDIGYTDPNETLTDLENYRKVALDTMITPRNLGMRGMREQSTKPPGPPTVDDVCFGLCGMALLEWTPKGSTAVYGEAEQFRMLWDIDDVGGWPDGEDTTNLFGFVTGLDPTTTYYFAVRALNGFGSALSSSPYKSGIPKNLTKPNSPTNGVGTDDQAGAISLSWNGPTDHVSGKHLLSCTSGSSKAAPFRSGEISGYEVKRSTNPTFDPASEGTLVAGVGSTAVNITVANNTVSFTDKSAAPCKTYYYKVRAVKSACTSTSDGYSDWYPTAADDGIKGQALSTGSPPKAPLNLAVDSAGSSVDVAGNVYKVKLDWTAVKFDTSNNPIGVDEYVITRKRRIFGTTAAFVDDPMGGAPQKTGALPEGNLVSFTDTTAQYQDPTTLLQWEYEYSVAAKTCSDVGADSPTATYPPLCSLSGSSVVQAGASSGTGSAASPWVMGAGDSVQVIAPAGETLAKAVFSLYDGTSSLVGTVVDTTASDGFIFPWSPQGDGATYSLVIMVTNVSGCIETLTRYIQDLTIAECAVLTVTPEFVSEVDQGGNTTLVTYRVKIDNVGPSENLQLDSTRFSWTNTSSGNSSLVAVLFDTIAASGVPANAANNINITAPTGTLSVTPGNDNYYLVFRFERQTNKTQLINPITKVCIRYRISSEPGVVKACNVFGGLGATNPAACD